MLQFFLGNLVRKLYGRFFIPKKLWGFDQNNGVIIVVLARDHERWCREARESYSLFSGQPIGRMQVHAITTEYLLFTDRPEYQYEMGSRASQSAVGSLAEFDLFFRHHFVQRMAIEIPTAKYCRMGGHQMLGAMSNPEDFSRVLRYADELIRR